MGKKSLSQVLFQEHKKCKLSAIIPVAFGALFTSLYLPSTAVAMEDYLSYTKENDYKNNTIYRAMPNNYRTPNIERRGDLGGLSVSKTRAYTRAAEPAFDNKPIVPYDRWGQIQQNPDDIGNWVHQQSYGGSYSLKYWHEVGVMGYYASKQAANVYFYATDDKPINMTMEQWEFAQTLRGTNTRKSALYVKLTNPFRANIEAYTGKFDLYNHVSWNAGFHFSIRGVNPNSYIPASDGIEVNVLKNIDLVGAIQGTNRNDIINFTGGQQIASPKLKNAKDYINLVDGNDTLIISADISSIRVGAVFMGSGNDLVVLDASNYQYEINGGIELGSGHNTIKLAGSKLGNILGDIYSGDGDDYVNYSAGFVPGGIDFYLGNGNDSVEISANTGYRTFDLGHGNNTIQIKGSRSINDTTFKVGDGNSLFDVDASRFTGNFSMGRGTHTIRVSSGYYKGRSAVNIPNGLGFFLEATNGGKIEIGSVNNQGIFGISIGNRSTYSGPTDIRGGRVDVHFYGGSNLTSDFISVNGNDRYTFESSNSSNYGIKAGGGTNTISVTDSSLSEIGTWGRNDTVKMINSTIGYLNAIGTNNISVEVGGTTFNRDGLIIDDSGNIDIIAHDQITMQGNAKFKATANNHNVEFDNATFSGNNTLEFMVRGNMNMVVKNNFSAGDIKILNGSSNIRFDGARSGTVGTLYTANKNDSVLFDNGSVFKGNINLGNADQAGDTIALKNSTINGGINFIYQGKLNLYGRERSLFDANLQATNAIDIDFSGNSELLGSITHNTEKRININVSNSARIQSSFTINTTKPLDLYIKGKDSSHFQADLVSGNANDTIELHALDTMIYSGKIDAGEGNNLLILEATSRNAGITEIKAGRGNDTAKLDGGIFAGGTTFQLGQGNNSIEVRGNTTMTGDLLIYETQNTNTRIEVKNGAIFTGDIHTGASRGDVIVEPRSAIDGNIQGLADFTFTARDNSTVRGDIRSGTGHSEFTLQRALIEGNIESNRAGTTRANINNTTIRGSISAVSNGSTVDMVASNSDVGGNIQMNNAKLTGTGSIFRGTLITQGNSTVHLSNTTMEKEVSFNNGSSNTKFKQNTISGDFALTGGEHTIVLDNNKIDGNVQMRNSSANLQSNGNTYGGDILLSSSTKQEHSTLRFNNDVIKGNINLTTSNVNHMIQMDHTRVLQSISVGIGKNTITMNGSTISGDITFRGFTVARLLNTEVLGKLNFTEQSLRDQYLEIDGNVWNSIKLGTRNNNVFVLKNGVLKDDQGVSLQGSNLIDVVYLKNSYVKGSIQLGAGNDYIRLDDTIVNGGIELSQGKNTIVLNNAFVGGDIVAQKIEVNRVGAVYEQLTRSDNRIGVNNFTTTTIHNKGLLFVTPNSVGDVLDIYGDVHIDRGAMGVDVDFIKGTHDTIMIKKGALVHGASQFIYVNPVNIFTGQEPLKEKIEGVLIAEEDKSFEYLPRLTNLYVQAGGYLYELQHDETKPNTYNLVLGGKDPFNFGYGTMALTARNYTRSILDALEQEHIISMLSTSSERKSYISKNNKDLFSAWVQTSFSTNTMEAPFIPKVNTDLATVLIGVDFKEIDIKGKDRFFVRGFGSYGNSNSKYIYSGWEVTGELQAYSAGAQFGWENLRNDKYRVFVRSTTWADIFSNTLSNTMAYTPEKWSSYTVSTALAAGIKLKFNKLIVIPEAELVYSYHSKSEFVSMTQNLIEIKNAHQVTAKIQGTIGYNFDIGLTPYARIALEAPLRTFPNDANGVYVAGEYYRYAMDDVLTRFGAGLNYAVSFGGVDLTAFMDISMNVGRESGYKGSLGVAVGF